MRITAPAIGGSVVALAAALVWRFSPEPSPPPAETTAPALDGQPPLPLAEPVQAAAPAPPETNAEQTPPPPFERAPLPGETPRRPMAELVAERRSGPQSSDAELPENIAAIELDFANEPVDRTWAPGAEAAIYAGLAQIPGLTVIDQRVECRSTMCRLEMTQSTSANGRLPFNMASFNMLRDSVGLEPRWMAIGESGSAVMRSIGYFYREGSAPTPRARQSGRSSLRE